MLWKVVFSAILALTLSGCATPDGNSVGSADTYHPSFQDGKADDPGVDTDVTSNQPQDAGIDAVGSEDGATDEPDTSCIPDPNFLDRVETACKSIDGKAVWKFDSATCTWNLGLYPNANPILFGGVPNPDLQWARDYFGCPATN